MKVEGCFNRDNFEIELNNGKVFSVDFEANCYGDYENDTGTMYDRNGTGSPREVGYSLDDVKIKYLIFNPTDDIPDENDKSDIEDEICDYVEEYQEEICWNR